MKFYLGAKPESYVPFDNAIEGAESLGVNQDWENPEEGIEIGFHTKEELISFIGNIESNLLSSIETLPLNDNSGFEWYPYWNFISITYALSNIIPHKLLNA